MSVCVMLLYCVSEYSTMHIIMYVLAAIWVGGSGRVMIYGDIKRSLTPGFQSSGAAERQR